MGRCWGLRSRPSRRTTFTAAVTRVARRRQANASGLLRHADKSRQPQHYVSPGPRPSRSPNSWHPSINARHLDTASTNNAFATWKTQPDHPAAAPTPAATAVAEQFHQNHHLTGVMIAGPRAFAVVDGNMVAVGQSVEGVKLASVTQRAATWQTQDGASFVMAIEDHAHRAAR